MTSIMNNKYNIKETHNVSEASSFEDRKIKSGLKESALRNNKTMNNKYKIKETHNVSEASSFEDRKIKSGLMESALSNNKTMNNDYRTTIMDGETPRMQVVMSAKY